jgi:DNA-binding winged helix-turn-helix (wHTH) protein
MDQIIRTVLHFDQFALDLTRGYLRKDGRDVELPPKPFLVLRHLAENAGRLVSKGELNEAVWPDVTVTDDSLVQCIRELRQKLGDHDHRLIKTIPRRGYMLDATLIASPLRSAAGRLQDEQRFPSANGGAWRRGLCAIAAYKLHLTAAMVFLACSGGVAIYLPTMFAGAREKVPNAADMALLPRRPAPASELLSTIDVKRVADLAASKQLPLPPFVIRRPADGVPDSYRRFVGIWVSDAGWSGSSRKLMLIVATVDVAGIAEGYVVDGPPQPKSRDLGPARFSPFIARISGEAFYFGSITGERVVSLMSNGQVAFKRTWRDGSAASVMLDPAWTLMERERKGPTDARG